MDNPSQHRSVLPYLLALALTAGCCLCLAGSAGAAGVYALVHRAPAPRPSATPPLPSQTVPPSPMAAADPATAAATAPDATAADSGDPDAWRRAGNPDASVVVEEFADFQCPYCAGFHRDGEPRLREEYIQTGKILFVFRFAPILDGGKSGGESHLAALAALCAGEQGKFWEYHDYLFENQPPENSGGFAAGHLADFAADLDLARADFSGCLADRRYASLVESDVSLAEDRVLQGVPTFFVNDRELLGYDETEFFDAIDSALTG